MFKFPPVVVSIIACAAGVATALLSTVTNFTLREVCIGVIAAAGTFGIGHSVSAPEVNQGPDPYLESDK